MTGGDPHARAGGSATKMSLKSGAFGSARLAVREQDGCGRGQG